MICTHNDQKATPDSSSSSKESYIVMMKDEPILTHDIDTTQSNQERKLNRKRYVDTKISLSMICLIDIANMFKYEFSRHISYYITIEHHCTIHHYYIVQTLMQRTRSRRSFSRISMPKLPRLQVSPRRIWYMSITIALTDSRRT